MLSDNEVWEKIKKLEGKTLETYTHFSPNEIIDVTNNEILIKNRSTRPVREDIITAYKLLFENGELERKRDLLELAQLDKQTSSIIFRIVGELAKNEITIIRKDKVLLKLKTQ